MSICKYIDQFYIKGVRVVYIYIHSHCINQAPAVPILYSIVRWGVTFQFSYRVDVVHKRTLLKRNRICLHGNN